MKEVTDHAKTNLFTFDNKLRPDAATPSTPASTRIELPQDRHGPALLQRLPDQLHAGGLHHQGRAGDQGQAQVLPAGARSTRRSRSPAPAARRSTRRSRSTSACRLEDRRRLEERRPGRDRTGHREQERLRVPRLRGHEAGRLRAGRRPQRLHRQRDGRLRRVPRQPRRLLRPARWPGASTASPTACGPRSPASSAPCRPGLGDVRPGAEGQQRRDQTPGGGLSSPTRPDRRRRPGSPAVGATSCRRTSWPPAAHTASISRCVNPPFR